MQQGGDVGSRELTYRQRQIEADKARARAIHRRDPELTYKEIGDLLGRGSTAVARWLREEKVRRRRQ
jgi:hypothetical protein